MAVNAICPGTNPNIDAIGNLTCLRARIVLGRDPSETGNPRDSTGHHDLLHTIILDLSRTMSFFLKDSRYNQLCHFLPTVSLSFLFSNQYIDMRKVLFYMRKLPQLEEKIKDKIQEAKNNMHPAQNREYIESLKIEIETLNWVLNEILVVSR